MKTTTTTPIPKPDAKAAQLLANKDFPVMEMEGGFGTRQANSLETA